MALRNSLVRKKTTDKRYAVSYAPPRKPVRGYNESFYKRYNSVDSVDSVGEVDEIKKPSEPIVKNKNNTPKEV